MATDRQIAANRANARKSTGPRTAAGKATSSRNSTSHGLCSSQFVLQPGEEFPQHAWRQINAHPAHRDATSAIRSFWLTRCRRSNLRFF